MKNRKHPSHESKRLMKANRLLSNPWVIACICALVFAVGFLLINYLINTLFHVRDILTDYGNMSAYTGISNAFRFDSKYVFLYVLAAVLTAYVSGRLAYQLYTSYRELNIGQKGTGRWAELEEIRRQYRAVPEKTEAFEGRGGIPVSRYGKVIYIDDTPVNNLIIGTTGSGKGETFVVSTIDIYSRAGHKPSLIVSDPKLELAAASKETLEKRGYEVHILNLIAPLNSMGYNPLSLITKAWLEGNTADSQMLARTFAYSIFNEAVGETNAKSQFFIETATSLLTALILAHIEDCIKYGEKEKINMYSIINLFVGLSGRKVDDKGTTELDVYFNSRGPGNIARLQFISSGIAGEETKGNIYASMMSKLNSFSLNTIAAMTSKSTLDMEMAGFGEKPIAVFMGIPDYDTSNHFLSSVFIRQLYFELSKKATLVGNGKCRREVVFLLDEFGNLPPIEGMGNIITVCRGRNIRFNLIVQSYSQLYATYGTNTANTIIGNCANQIYILSIEQETAEKFSKLVGSETITTVSRHGKKMQFDKSFTESYEERPLINPNELMELHEGEYIVKRVIKRRDLNGNDIIPYPVFNRGRTRMKYRYEYLAEEFDTAREVPQGAYDELGRVYLPDIMLDGQKIVESLMDGSYYGSNIGDDTYMVADRLTPDKLFLIAQNIDTDPEIIKKMDNISFEDYLARLVKEQKIKPAQKQAVLDMLD